MHSRLLQCVVLHAILLMTFSRGAHALRGFSTIDKAAAHALNVSQQTTSYGQPVIQTGTKSVAVDHFGSGQYTRNETFEQRFALLWPEDKPNDTSPIFLFCGQESTLAESGVGAGWYSIVANTTGALQIWPEHRYYADSPPFRPDDDFAHFTIEQSLVDHIELVLYIQALTNMTRSPVIAIGSSYSGQIAQWLRMRYPDVIAGAISSSPTSFGCPGLGLDPSYDPYGFSKTATRAASSEGGSAPACAANVQNFFQTIFALANNSSGLDDINTNLGLCPNSQVTSLDDVNQTLAKYVTSQWISAAQYNSPTEDASGVPGYRVRVACEHLADAGLAGDELLMSMVEALTVFDQNASIANGCLDITGSPPNPENTPPAEGPSSSLDDTVPAAAPEIAGEPETSTKATSPQTSDQKFAYQVCNQDTTPVSSDGVSDMFYNNPFSLDGNDAECVARFGIHAQYNWAAYNFGLAAVRQSSNIFFTNGEFDPYTACGPTVNISDTITTATYEGCHAGDFGLPDPEDPPSVTAVRLQGVSWIGTWVAQYNAAKQAVPLSNAADLFNLNYALGGYTQNVNDTLAGSETGRTQLLLEPSASYSNSIAAM